MRRWLLAGLGLAVAGILAVALWSRARRVEVATGKVESGDVRGTVSAPGEILPRTRIDVAAQVIGRIEKVHVREGDSVRPGDRLVDLDPAPYAERRDRAAAALAAAAADVRRAEAALENAGAKRERARQLAAQKIASPEFLASAERGHANATATLAAARERARVAETVLDAATDALSKTSIDSPAAGRVVRIGAEEGETAVPGAAAVPGTVILSIVDPARIEANCDVAADAAVRIRRGQKATVTADEASGRELRAEVVDVASAGRGSVVVRVRLLDAPAGLRAGGRARVRIEADGRERVLVVPVGAVVDPGPGRTRKADASSKQDARKIVYRIEGDRAKACPVQIGLTDDTRAEIVSGLQNGETIAIGPHRTLETLRDGAAVVEAGKRKG
jgi:HlyD family secretion protein